MAGIRWMGVQVVQGGGKKPVVLVRGFAGEKEGMGWFWVLTGFD